MRHSIVLAALHPPEPRIVDFSQTEEPLNKLSEAWTGLCSPEPKVIRLERRKPIELPEIADSAAGAAKFLAVTVLTRILVANLRQNGTLTKRDVYYRNTSVFGSQSALDAALELVSSALDTPLELLHVYLSPKSLLYATFPVTLKVGDKRVDLGPRQDALLVPHCSPNESAELSADPSAIVVFEKEAVFRPFCAEAITQRLLVVTGKGYPDWLARRLLGQLERHKVPIILFVDSDVYGLSIHWLYALAAPTTQLGGVFLTDYANCLVTITGRDMAHGIGFLKRLPRGSVLHREMTRGLKLGKKAEMNQLDEALRGYVLGRIGGLLPHVS